MANCSTRRPVGADSITPKKRNGIVLCNIEIGEIAGAEEFLSFCGCKEKLMLEKRG